MSEIRSLSRPEVSAFVEDVRRLLADLDDEVREDLVGGLEADLSDQVADGSPLGDPAAYAAELRAAAGLPDRGPARARRRPLGPTLGGLLDAARGRFDDLVAHPWISPVWEVLSALRPAWWVLRAWLAITLADVVLGGTQGWAISIVPTLRWAWLSWAVLVVAIAGSTLIGIRRVWPGTGGTGARCTLIALNVFAVVAPIATLSIALPGYLVGQDPSASMSTYAAEPVAQPGLVYNDRVVSNLFAYDAHGRPIDGVQLVDQDGRPITLPQDATITAGRRGIWGSNCPVWNGNQPSRGLFPLAQLANQRCTTKARAATAKVPPHPLASLPPVTRPAARR